MCYMARATYWQYVFCCDHEDVVSNQSVPVAQDALDGFQQQIAPKEQEVEAGHHIAHAKVAGVGHPSDEDDGEHEPEEVTEDDHHGYVQVWPGQWNQETTQTAAQMKLGGSSRGREYIHTSSSWPRLEAQAKQSLWSLAGPCTILTQLVTDRAVLCENAVCTFIIIKLRPNFPQAATFFA